MTPECDHVLVFVDEASDNTTTWHGALIVPLQFLPATTATWLKYRDYLRRTYGVPSDFHLHASEWIHRRTEVPNGKKGINHSLEVRRHAAEGGFKTIGGMSRAAVYVHTAPMPHLDDAWALFVADLRAILAAHNWTGVIVVDHNSNAVFPTWRTSTIQGSAILGVLPVAAARHQLVQVADHIAHLALQANTTEDHKGSDIAPWFASYLHRRETNGACACPQKNRASG